MHVSMIVQKNIFNQYTFSHLHFILAKLKGLNAWQRLWISQLRQNFTDIILTLYLVFSNIYVYREEWRFNIFFFFIKDHISSALGINPPPPTQGPWISELRMMILRTSQPWYKFFTNMYWRRDENCLRSNAV